MATSLLALLDDITSVLDDVATMTKVAAKKTSGVLGDDLALNAQQVAGVHPERELPVVWAVAKGSIKNKAVLVPAALLVSTLLPSAVVPLLMIGGAYLCFEGVEKLAHSFFHSKENTPEDKKLPPTEVNEKEKIQGAIRTDFILSSEIIVISLGQVAEASWWTRVSVLVGISLLMTLGVYGFVALIVKLDDAGLHLMNAPQAGLKVLGRGLLRLAPWLMKALSVAGTVAMFLVGGGLLTHPVPDVHAFFEKFSERVGAFVSGAVSMVFDAGVGMLVGLVVLGGVIAVKKAISLREKH